MKNRIKLMVFTLLMCVVMVPAMKANASGSEEVWQTAAGKNSVTISWTNDYNGYATNYKVYLDGRELAIVENTTNSYKINNLGEGSSHLVCVSAVIYGQEGFLNGKYNLEGVEGGDKAYFVPVFTTPKKVTGVKYNEAFAKTNKVSVYWKKNADFEGYGFGYEAVCYGSTGKKKVQTIKDIQTNKVTFSKTNTQKIYRVKVRSYITIKDGKKIYGPYSNFFYAVPQPMITSTNSDVSRYSVKLKWKKVSGATKYAILVSKNKNSGYKKVATVKGSTTSYTVKNIDTLYNTYYFKVITFGKFGNKIKKSGSEYYVTANTYYY